jgi:hypothetical protein
MVGIRASNLPACPIVHPPSPSLLLERKTGASKVAVNVAAVSTIQVPVPTQPPPLHPIKVEPELLVAVRVTVVPFRKVSLQVVPQSIPGGSDMTVPDPVPTFATTKLNVPGGGARLKVAVTVASTVS